MGVKVTCNHLLLLLFYTYFLAAWVGDFSFPWFFSQGFPFTDIAEFHFTSTVSPGSILGRVRRDHKEKWKIETIQIQQEYSPSSERTFLFSYGWELFQLSSLPWFSSRTPKYIQQGPHFLRGVRMRAGCIQDSGAMRARRKHSTPLCSHQHSIVYVHITRWLWQGNAG